MKKTLFISYLSLIFLALDASAQIAQNGSEETFEDKTEEELEDERLYRSIKSFNEEVGFGGAGTFAFGNVSTGLDGHVYTEKNKPRSYKDMLAAKVWSNAYRECFDGDLVTPEMAGGGADMSDDKIKYVNGYKLITGQIPMPENAPEYCKEMQRQLAEGFGMEVQEE